MERTAASAMETAKIANAPDAPDAAQIADAAISRKRTQNDMVWILYGSTIFSSYNQLFYAHITMK